MHQDLMTHLIITSFTTLNNYAEMKKIDIASAGISKLVIRPSHFFPLKFETTPVTPKIENYDPILRPFPFLPNFVSFLNIYKHNSSISVKRINF